MGFSEQTGRPIRFSAFFTAAKRGRTGLVAAGAITVDVYAPAGQVVVNAVPVEVGGGWYSYTLAGTATGTAGEYQAVFKTGDTTCDMLDVPDIWSIGRVWVNNVDQPVSSRSDLTAAGVWSAPGRSLTDHGALVGDIWANANRTLTAFGFQVVVGVNTDKVGYQLSPAGLDLIPVADPGPIGSMNTFPKLLVALWRYFYKQTTANLNQLKTYKDDNVTVNVTMPLANDGTTQTKGSGI